jgi:hypothetical protein
MVEGSFEFSNPRVERIVFGYGKVKTVREEIARFGASRALVVVSPSVAKTPLREKVLQTLGPRCVGVCDRIQPHSPTEGTTQRSDCRGPARSLCRHQQGIDRGLLLAGCSRSGVS